jgi:hypothetical protein
MEEPQTDRGLKQFHACQHRDSLFRVVASNQVFFLMKIPISENKTLAAFAKDQPCTR